MSGQYNGVQSLIRSKNPQATFIWRWSHTLNFVVTDTVSIDFNAMDLFGNLEKIYDFISSSHKRTALFIENQSKFYPKKSIRRVNRVEATRWMSHKFVLNTIIETLNALLETLNAIRLDKGISDRRTVSEAGGLFTYITSKRFIYLTFIFKKILEIIEFLSLFLQSLDIDLLVAVSVVTDKFNHFQKTRNETVFNQTISDTDKYINDNSNVEFTAPQEKRTRKRKIMPDEKIIQY